MIAKRRHSIRGRLIGIIMLTSTAAVLLASLAFGIDEGRDERSRLIDDLSTLAQLIGSNSTAALTFGDRISAAEVLNALRAKPSVIAACIYDLQGEPFARYTPNPSTSLPRVLLADGFHQHDARLELFYEIRFDRERIGTLYIASDDRDRNARLKQYAAISTGIVLISLLAAFVLSSWLQRSISEPIVELARVAKLVSQHKNFSARASHPRLNDSDEIGNLMSGFNGMLAEIEQRDDSLLLHQTDLEETVALRTSELTTANEKLQLAKNVAETVAEANARLARESALILNNATVGIIGVGLDSRPIFLNPAAANMLSITLPDVADRSIHDAFHHSRADGTAWPGDECPAGQAMRRGEPYSIPNDLFWRPDGSSFPVEYSATPMLDEHGKNLGAVLMFRDVTERRAIERLKNEFVSTVSHELRTPLTSIRGALGLLTSGLLGPIADKGQRMLEIAIVNTDRLVRLINDILDLERIESGKVELARDIVNANDVMVLALESVQAMADDAGVALRVITPPAESLWGDSDRIIQTLTNLLGNAIKFSPPDTTVTLSGSRRETDFAFCIADQGRGVPEQKLGSIFDRFSQVDSSDSRDKGGSGLGLAICRSIALAHGGQIWAEANDPAGSRFQFTIPLASSSPDAVAVSETSSPAMVHDDDLVHAVVDLARDTPSILVVEDNLDLARVMITTLQSHGMQIFHAVNGSDALRLCAQHEPTLIVLDLVLPDMDGFAIVRSLRESATLQRTSLLVYSAAEVSSADQSSLRLGRTDFLTKSRCSLAEFEQHVVRLLDTATSRTKAGQHAA